MSSYAMTMSISPSEPGYGSAPVPDAPDQAASRRAMASTPEMWMSDSLPPKGMDNGDAGTDGTLVRALAGCVKVLDNEGKVVFFDESSLRAMEIDDFKAVEGIYWPLLWPADKRETVERALRDARANGMAAFSAPRPTAKGTPKWWDVAIAAIPNAGPKERFLVISRDITVEKEAADRDQMLFQELVHRINNTLAVVSAIFHQSMNSSPDRKSLAAAFPARLAAIANANSVLLKSQHKGANLKELVSAQLAPYLGEGRLTADGPETHLSASAAQPLALALNELATNALKYGSLSREGGTASLRWMVETTAEGAFLVMEWREHGGPAVAAPRKRGFGSHLIERGIPGAEVKREFNAAGLICTIRFSLAA